MPYNPDDPSGWPAHVRKLPAKRGRQWAHVWNGVFEETGDEGRAFAAANATALRKVDRWKISGGKRVANA